MKRFWLELKSKYTEVNNANNSIVTVDVDGLEKSYTLPNGTFDPMVLATKVNSVISAKYGEINDDIKKDFLVLFLEENIMYLRGSFIQYLTKGIEQTDMNDSLVNGSESFLPLYIPDGIETTDVSRNPQWNIARLENKAKFTYQNGEETAEGELVALDNIGRLFKVDDRLKDNYSANYAIHHVNSISGEEFKTKFNLKTNNGTLIENQFYHSDNGNNINVIETSTDGRYTIYVSPSPNNSSILIRDSYTGKVATLVNGKSFENVKRPIQLCKSGEFKDKRLAVNFVDSEKFFVEIYDIEKLELVFEPVRVFSEGKKLRPEYILNKDFTRLVYFDEYYTILTSQDITTKGSQIKKTYNIGQLTSSLGTGNGRPYILAMDNNISKVVFYISTKGKHRVVFVELETLTARNYYTKEDYTIKDVGAIYQFSDNQFIVTARIHDNKKGLYCEALVSLNVNWVGYQIIEEVKVLTNGSLADDSEFYSSGLDLDLKNGVVYTSVAHNLNIRGYLATTKYPFNEELGYLRVDQNQLYPYDNKNNDLNKYIRGLKVVDNTIVYADNKTVYKKIL